MRSCEALKLWMEEGESCGDAGSDQETGGNKGEGEFTEISVEVLGQCWGPGGGQGLSG